MKDDRTRETIDMLTKIADYLLDLVGERKEASGELCEAAAQIIEAKRRIAKRLPENVKTVTRER